MTVLFQDKAQDWDERPMPTQISAGVGAALFMAMHHIDNTEQLLQTFAAHLESGGMVALADLDREDGSFHPADVEGVFHQGFDREQLRALLARQDFEAIEFTTAVEVTRNGRSRRKTIPTAGNPFRPVCGRFERTAVILR